MENSKTLKNNILFDRISESVILKTERLTISKIEEADKERYASLYLDDELNKWWGYDYREDLGDNKPSPDYFFNFQNLLKEKKEEFSFAVKKDSELIGELVLHNFGEDDSVEMGFRFFKNCQGKGYALESASKLKEYVFNTLGAVKLRSRCYKENFPSANLIKRLGLEKSSENDTHYFFELIKK